jgi:hypothetical protein
MATKAEEFRYWQQRSGPKKPKSPPRQRRDSPVDTSAPGVSATARKAGRAPSPSAGRKATFALEQSTGRPSRMSTRKATNRQRTDTKMQAKARTREGRPTAPGVKRGR